MSERVLDLVPAQAEALRALMQAVNESNARLALAFEMVIRGHGLTQASEPRLTGNQLTVTVPEG